MKSRKMMVCAIAALFAVFALLCACSSNEPQKPDYADDEAMALIAKGLEARWAITDSSSYESNAENLKKAINAELNVIKPLRDRQFENPKMQQDILAYINKTEEQLGVVNDYGFNSAEYFEKWDKVYDERTSLLKGLADNYGLTVSKAKQSTLDDLLANGKAAQKKSSEEKAIKELVEGINWDKEDKGYGYYEYSATLENTTDKNYKSVGLSLALYDESDVRAGETYASISNWEKGEKARFETTSDIDAARIKTTLSYFTVDE